MPPKAKQDTAADYQKFKKDLSAGQVGTLYLFHGEEAYLRDYYLGKLKQLLVGGGMEEFNLHTLQGKDLTPHVLEEAVDCLPMMSERTLVLVYDYDLWKAGENDREKYLKILSDLPEYCCLVFVYDLIPYKADARTKLAALFKEKGSVVAFARQGQGDLVDWIKKRFRALDKEIDSEECRYLMFLCGDLMNGLIGEIEKLGAYAKSKRVTRQDIDAVATPQLDAVVFRMTDAIGEGNFDQAAAVLGDLLRMQEAPIKILYFLGKQMRQLYSARLALEQHRDRSYLMELWGLRNPYPAERLLAAARKFELPWSRNAVVRCGEIDLAMKSTGVDGQELLVALLLELAGTPAKGA